MPTSTFNLATECGAIRMTMLPPLLPKVFLFMQTTAWLSSTLWTVAKLMIPVEKKFTRYLNIFFCFSFLFLPVSFRSNEWLTIHFQVQSIQQNYVVGVLFRNHPAVSFFTRDVFANVEVSEVHGSVWLETSTLFFKKRENCNQIFRGEMQHDTLYKVKCRNRKQIHGSL